MIFALFLQDVEALRSWRFEGSRDQVTWTLLRHHVNDATLCKKGQVAVFPIDEAAVYGVASGAWADEAIHARINREYS